jgi:hypothetical protein
MNLSTVGPRLAVWRREIMSKSNHVSNLDHEAFAERELDAVTGGYEPAAVSAHLYGLCSR